MGAGLRLGVAALAIVALTVGGCGRKGPLERPTSGAVANSSGQVVQPERPDRPFILDGLIR